MSARADAFANLCTDARGATNMAVDHVLFEGVQRGGPPVLRLYAWDPPCLSLGRNQHARGLYDETLLAEAGIDIVRRPTGGLAVLHDIELTYTVLVPAALLGGARATYRSVNEALVAGLRALGVPAGLADSGARRDPRHDAAQPCFEAPADGEVVAAGRKLVGSAQRCEAGTLLQHGSILLDGTQDRILRLLRQPVGAGAGANESNGDDAGMITAPVQSGSVTLRELLGVVPGWAAVARSVTRGFTTMCGTRLAPVTLTSEERGRLADMEARYDDEAWTWRL
ncbi:lipoate--protein ligase family protein [soil metagenome]